MLFASCRRLVFLAFLVFAALAPASAARALGAGDIVGLGGPALAPTGPSRGLHRVAVQPDGQVLVAGNDGVQRLDPDTGAFTPLSSEATRWVETSASGRIFVTSGGDIYELDPLMGTRTPLLSSPQTLIGLSAAVPGSLLMAREVPVDDPDRPDVLQERQVLSFDLNTSAVTVLSATPSVVEDPDLGETSFSFASDLFATPAGTVFVSRTVSGVAGEGGIVASPTPGTPSYFWGEQGEAGGFVVDEQGRMVVAVFDQIGADVFRITRVGNVDVTEPLDLADVFFGDLTLVPVPEPASLLLVGTGLALLGRRRARSAAPLG